METGVTLFLEDNFQSGQAVINSHIEFHISYHFIMSTTFHLSPKLLHDLSCCLAAPDYIDCSGTLWKKHLLQANMFACS